MRDKGVRFIPIYGRQAFKIDGKFKFWGGLTVEVGRRRAGPGRTCCTEAADASAASRCATRRRALDLLLTTARASRACASSSNEQVERAARAKSVVLACGGFEANPEWRTRYLGPGWDLAKVRGTRFNTGDGIRMALDDRRQPARQLVGLPRGRLGPATRRSSATSRSATTSRSTPIRSASWSTPTASASSTRAPTSATTPTRNTAASSSSSPASSPGRSSTRRSTHLLRDEYRIRQVTKVTRRHDRGAGDKLEGVDADAVPQDRSRNTTRRCARTFRSTPTSRTAAAREGLAINKSNWANTLDTPPFEAYAVTCGITFTFGGLRINTDGAGARHRLAADPRALCGRRAGRRPLLLQLSGRHRASSPARCSARSPAPRRDAPGRTDAAAMAQRLERALGDRDRAPHRGRRDHRGSGGRAIASRASPRASRWCTPLRMWIPSWRCARRARSIAGPAAAPLHGVPIGIKDVIDTADQPTQMGSPIYRGHRPACDAACVAVLRARRRRHPGQDRHREFAGMTAGPTTNPHNPGAYAGRLVERIGGRGRRPHAAGRARHPDRRLGAAARRLLRGDRLQADLRRLQPRRPQIRGRKPRHHRADGALASTTSRSSPRSCSAASRARRRRSAPRPGSDCAARRCGRAPSRRPGTRSRTRRRGSRKPARRCATSRCPEAFAGLKTAARETINNYERSKSMAAEWASHRDLISPKLARCIALGMEMPYRGVPRRDQARRKLPRAAARRIRGCSISCWRPA